MYERLLHQKINQSGMICSLFYCPFRKQINYVMRKHLRAEMRYTMFEKDK